MLKGEHSAILSTSIKLPFVIKIFVLSIFEQPFYTGFTHQLTKTNLQHNDRAMIRQICSIKPENVATATSKELLAKLKDLDLILRERLHWFGHVERSSGAVRTACDIQIDGRRPKLTWKKLMEKDCHEWKLMTVDPQERSTWRSGVRSAMHATSQLLGRWSTDVDDPPPPPPHTCTWPTDVDDPPPPPAHYKKSDYDDDMIY